jgi:RNA polymerase sigma-70 factor (ECF subfamily)
MNDRELMEGLVGHDRTAGEVFVNRYQKRLFKFFLGWVGNREDALDLTQEVLVRVYQKANTYNGDAPLSAWVFRVARNLHLDQRRKRNFKVNQRSVNIEDIAPGRLSRRELQPERVFAKKELVQEVSRAIDLLPPRQREVVRLRLLGELKLDEIAETVGLSVGGVKSTLHNALARLRKNLSSLERGAYVDL